MLAPIERHPYLASLLHAIEERREVTFMYAKVDDPAPVARRILPWILVFRGSWYLIGWDVDKNKERRFKLSRMASDPEVGDVAGYEIPEAIAGISEPWRLGDESLARIAVDPAQMRSIARRVDGRLQEAEDGTPVLEVPFGDEASFASLLTGFGPAVEVLDPPSLRRAVIERLQGILAAGEAT